MTTTSVAGATTARADGPLKLAVPRGALFDSTLAMLDRAGLDTDGLRSDSRSMIFDGSGVTLVTMRPSDVPTYVEAGAADLGITGKDVLLEQFDRVVYELLDLGYGECRMVLAGREGDERLGEAERRLGAMRIATKYPRVAERYFEQTGRQAEVIEGGDAAVLALTERFDSPHN
ncbi:MAG TPA: ATP phosphoribosyltransferase, partial [Solirubrobacteraceae bacterium]